MLPKDLDVHFLNQIFNEAPAPIVGGMSLEGQRPGAPNFNDPRQAYAFTQIGNGTLLDAIWPSRNWAKVDPIANITPSFPPTFIVHGAEDIMVPVDRSRELYLALSRSGVRCDMRVIPGEGHTFAAKMEVGSRTWNLQREGFDFLESLLR
jgi:acetyl esterase/lipase